MYTPSKIKIRMLCALALCGQVRRDDLAIFARTVNAGVRIIRELESRGFIEDRDVEVMVRIDGRNRPRTRHVCNLTNAGLLFLLEHGASIFPWLASISKEIISQVNLKGGNCCRRIPLDRRLDLSGANCFFAAAGYDIRPLVFDEKMSEGKLSLTSCLAKILPPLDAANDRSFYNILEIKRNILGNGMAARFARQVGFAVHSGVPMAVYVVPQGGLSWNANVVNKERNLFDDFVLRGMHTSKDMGHDCILLVRRPRNLSRTLAAEPSKVVRLGVRYVVPMNRNGWKDLKYDSGKYGDENSHCMSVDRPRHWQLHYHRATDDHSHANRKRCAVASGKAYFCFLSPSSARFISRGTWREYRIFAGDY